MSQDIKKTEFKKISKQDAELTTRIGIALVLRQRAALRSIQFQVTDGQVVLQGELPSYFDRQLAIETVRHIAGVQTLRDELTVSLIDFADDQIPERTADWTQESVRLPRQNSVASATITPPSSTSAAIAATVFPPLFSPSGLSRVAGALLMLLTGLEIPNFDLGLTPASQDVQSP